MIPTHPSLKLTLSQARNLAQGRVRRCSERCRNFDRLPIWLVCKLQEAKQYSTEGSTVMIVIVRPSWKHQLRACWLLTPGVSLARRRTISTRWWTATRARTSTTWRASIRPWRACPRNPPLACGEYRPAAYAQHSTEMAQSFCEVGLVMFPEIGS